MEYIVFVTYGSDAERKRIDYLLDKWGERARIKKPRGIVFHIEAEEPQEFFQELFSRLEGNAEEKVEVYEAKRIRTRVETRKKKLEFTVDEERRVVERFIGYLLSKLNASFSHSDGMARVYSIYTRKGRGVIKVLLRGDGKTHILFEIEGYGDVVDFLAERIEEELKLFAGG